VQLAVANGIHWVDASYALPEFEALGSQAAAKGVTILPEFGLDPGIDLVLAGQAIKELDEIQGFFSYGSGVPEPAVADNPLKYKISWTFAGVLRSYQRPARVLRGGQAVDIPANEIFADENVHTLEISGLGKMEAYPNGDVMKYLQLGGLSETVQSAGRYALRWPGHCAFWKKMVDLGFLDETPFKVGDCAVSPQQFVHDLLEPQLHYREGERDVVVVGVDVRGLKGGQKRRIVYQVVDWRDRKTGLLAMQRTVGYTASIGAQMILRGDIQKRGLLSPLTDISSDKFFAELGQRGITVQREEQLEKFGSS
jgi:saccharopine dehydrogenase-like NADP-dependent oxidoreductase